MKLKSNLYNIFLWFLDFLNRYGLPILAFVCTWLSHYKLYELALFAGIVILLIKVTAEIFVGKSYVKLSKERDSYQDKYQQCKEKIKLFEENTSAIFEAMLRDFANNKLDFNATATNGNVIHDRITLYIHNATQRSFAPCGRYSRNPNFTRKNRTEFSDQEGCISKGWEDGWHFVSNSHDMNTFKSEYNLSQTTLNSIRMPSKFYAVMRINSEKDKALAIVVVESTKANRFDETVVQTALKDFSKDIVPSIEAMYDSIPGPAIARDLEL